MLYSKSPAICHHSMTMPEEEWDDYADPMDLPDDPDDWTSEADEL